MCRAVPGSFTPQLSLTSGLSGLDALTSHIRQVLLWLLDVPVGSGQVYITTQSNLGLGIFIFYILYMWIFYKCFMSHILIMFKTNGINYTIHGLNHLHGFGPTYIINMFWFNNYPNVTPVCSFVLIT